jgi:hypothetical protein
VESPDLAAIVVVVHYRLVNERLSIWLDHAPDGAPRLPSRALGSDEDETQAVQALVASMPFAREVLRRSGVGAFTSPERPVSPDGRREIALVSWTIVRVARAGEAVAERGAWHPVDELPELTGDHRDMVAAARRSLARDIVHDPVTLRLLPRHLLRDSSDELGRQGTAAENVPALFGLLPDPFPLSAIRRFYERLFEAEIDRGNFRRKLVELRPTGVVKELPIFQRGVRHRAAQLFTFDPRAWERWADGDD